MAKVLPEVSYGPCAVTWERAAPTRCEVRWFAVSAPPPGVAVARAASAIVRDRGEAFRGRSRLPLGTRWLRGSTVAAWRDLPAAAPARRELLGRAEVVLASALAATLPGARAPLPDVRLLPSSAGDGLVAVTLVTRLGADRGNEALRIERAFDVGSSAALFVPVEELGEGGVVMTFDPRGEATAAELAAARALADRAPPPPAPPMGPRALAWKVARDAIGARNRRPALLALVTPFRRARAVDVLAVADEPALAAVTAPMTAVDAEADDAGWQLERAMWRGLLPRIERRALTPALRAAVTRQLGALQEDPAALALLLATAADDAEFTRRVQAENVLALDDRSASLRTTAFTFLKRRGVAMPGYDPMDERARRHAAVRRLLRAQGDAR